MKPVSRKHLFIPDTQTTPTTPQDHLGWAGQYIVEKKPDVIACAGDFGDMPSLSSYDKGKGSFEGRRYKADIEAAKKGMRTLLKPMNDYNAKMIQQKGKQYKPEMHLTLGNHEDRITRAVEDNIEFEGFMGVENLGYESFGWTVHPFLDIVEIDGIHYSHYFTNEHSGRPIGGESIVLRMKKIGFSFVQGHQQMYLTGCRSLANGQVIRGLVLGSFYLHDEDYRKQSNNEWRGIVMLHEVRHGNYSLMEISLDYLCMRYEGMRVWEFMEKKYPELFKKSMWMQFQKSKD